MANHSWRWQKWLPSAAHMSFIPSSLLDGRQPPKQADNMALKTLRCCGKNASMPEQRSALRDISYPFNPPPKLYQFAQGLSPINLARRHEAQCLVWGVRGPFLLATAMVRLSLCVFCSVPGARTTFFQWNHTILGIFGKLLSRARQFLYCAEAET